MRKRAEGIIFFPMLLILDCIYKWSLLGKMQISLDYYASPKVDYQGGFLTYTRVIEN